MSKNDFTVPPQVFNPAEKDEEIINALKAAGYDPNECMQCGMCTASCTSGRWTAMRTRNIISRAALGDATILSDADIWLCTTCYSCFDRCPRDLKVTDVIIELRNIASARGFISDKHRKTVGILKKTGHGVPLNDKVQAIRKELGLEEIPPTIFRHEDEIKKLAKLFQLVEKEEEKEE